MPRWLILFWVVILFILLAGITIYLIVQHYYFKKEFVMGYWSDRQVQMQEEEERKETLAAELGYELDEIEMIYGENWEESIETIDLGDYTPSGHPIQPHSGGYMKMIDKRPKRS